ncbi:nucleoplasmin-like protein ANO39 isoform X2 [Manihot esculenta]|uniref:nucleoplasmin-like protein ANO39 isoform X2 n=1 Tax=Manihot esculenta TaxID=3983 RepID=UPI001CC79CC7|nr:nucleoplasmin-like protein ANO39 isoform X2 [Manihot esculenta]
MRTTKTTKTMMTDEGGEDDEDDEVQVLQSSRGPPVQSADDDEDDDEDDDGEGGDDDDDGEGGDDDDDDDDDEEENDDEDEDGEEEIWVPLHRPVSVTCKISDVIAPPMHPPSTQHNPKPKPRSATMMFGSKRASLQVGLFLRAGVSMIRSCNERSESLAIRFTV